MSPIDMFKVITEKGSYLIGYLCDGWTKELNITARSPREAMIKVQDMIGNIGKVTFIEREF